MPKHGSSIPPGALLGLELRSRKTVRFSEQTMSADKYASIFSRQMKTMVYIFLNLSSKLS